MNDRTNEILVIGAGASGLMAAKELSQQGKKVTILEARDRIGGRIYTFEKERFGYAAEAGAEFIHGDLPVTKSLLQEAGLTLLAAEGQMWDIRDGEPTQSNDFIPEWRLLIQKLKNVKDDLPIADFLDQNFPKEKYSHLHKAITGFVEGYDAADPHRASTIALRDEWTAENESEQFRIEEGYGSLIRFLEKKCNDKNVGFCLNAVIHSIELTDDGAKVQCTNGETFVAPKVILTVPLPVLQTIVFHPALPLKLKAATQIGFGKVIKFLFCFKDQWWTNALFNDLSELGFIFSNEQVPTWWTQYPETHTTLTGWLAGPNAERYVNQSSESLIDLGLTSLASMFKIEKEILTSNLIHSEVINWGKDPFSLGAYAYATPETPMAKEELLKPVKNILFFSGEALYSGKEMGTVEAALASGIKSARQILES